MSYMKKDPRYEQHRIKREYVIAQKFLSEIAEIKSLQLYDNNKFPENVHHLIRKTHKINAAPSSRIGIDVTEKAMKAWLSKLAREFEMEEDSDNLLLIEEFREEFWMSTEISSIVTLLPHFWEELKTFSFYIVSLHTKRILVFSEEEYHYLAFIDSWM